jgi:signal transduction histidine kinase
MCWTNRRTLVCNTEAPVRARNFCANVVSPRLGHPWIDAPTYDMRLVASELVTNALNAGCTDLRLMITLHRSRVRVSVFDNAPGLPRLVDAGPNDASGRGLAITAALALEVGLERASIGKEVWADLPVEPGLFGDETPEWCDQPPPLERVV